MKAGIAQEAKLDCKAHISPGIMGSNLTSGQDLWEVTERMRLWVQAADRSFLCEVGGLALRHLEGGWDSSSFSFHPEDYRGGLGT